MHECSLQSWSAYHLYEKPGNSGENLNGTVHPGGNVPDKRNTFRGITFFPFSPKRPEMFCTICLVNQCQASSWGKRWFVLTQVHSLSGLSQIVQLWPIPLFGNVFNSQYHLSETFYRNFLTKGSVPGPDFEYAPLSRPSMFDRDLNTPAGKLIIIHDNYS